MITVFMLIVLSLYITSNSIHGETETSYKSYILRKTCLLTPDQGPCRANLTMYYFEPNSKTCKTFKWGGCQGNGNRYDTEGECYNYCLSKRETRRGTARYCHLNFDYGYCFGAEMRWYYDKIWKVCKHTIFSGCGGNKNNFLTRKQCARVCRFGRDDGGGGGGGGGGEGGGGGDVINQIIVNPTGITSTTTCYRPRHTTTRPTTAESVHTSASEPGNTTNEHKVTTGTDTNFTTLPFLFP